MQLTDTHTDTHKNQRKFQMTNSYKFIVGMSLSLTLVGVAHAQSQEEAAAWAGSVGKAAGLKSDGGYSREQYAHDIRTQMQPGATAYDPKSGTSYDAYGRPMASVEELCRQARAAGGPITQKCAWLNWAGPDQSAPAQRAAANPLDEQIRDYLDVYFNDPVTIKMAKTTPMPQQRARLRSNVLTKFGKPGAAYLDKVFAAVDYANGLDQKRRADTKKALAKSDAEVARLNAAQEAACKDAKWDDATQSAGERCDRALHAYNTFLDTVAAPAIAAYDAAHPEEAGK